MLGVFTTVRKRRPQEYPEHQKETSHHDYPFVATSMPRGEVPLAVLTEIFFKQEPYR